MLVGSQPGFSENWGWFWLKRRRDEEWRGVFVVRGRRELVCIRFQSEARTKYSTVYFRLGHFFVHSAFFFGFGRQRESGGKHSSCRLC